MKILQRKIDAANKSHNDFVYQCDNVLLELYKHFDFDNYLDYDFSIDYSPSESALILIDNNDNNYALSLIMKYIENNGNITSFDELYQFSI